MSAVTPWQGEESDSPALEWIYVFVSPPSLVQRLQSKVLKLVDISYGGENGFNQAIELSTEVLSNVKFIQEKKLIGMWCPAASSRARCVALSVLVLLSPPWQSPGAAPALLSWLRV